MSDRLSYLLVVILFLFAAVWRMASVTSLPPGLHPDEITEIRLIETARAGRIEVYYSVDGVGHEGLPATLIAAVSSLLGVGVTGYRIAAIFAGMLSVALLYAVGKRMFGALAALAAAGLMALGMFPALLARSISAEAFVPLFITATLLALARSLPVYGLRTRHEPKTIPFAALGLLLGLGFYLHPVAYPTALMALIFIAFVIVARRLPGRRPLSRRTLSYTWFALVVLIVVGMPYLIATLGQPTLSGARRIFNGGWTVESVINALGGLIFVGDSSPHFNLPARPMFDLISGIVILVGILTALRFGRQPRCLLLLIALALLLPIGLIAPDSPDFARFAGVLPILALLFGLGVTTLINSVPYKARLRAGVVGLVGLLAFNVGWTGRDLLIVYPANAVVREVNNARLGQIARHLDRTVETTPTVICESNLRPPSSAARLSDAQLIALMMHRPTATARYTIRYADCGAALILPDGGERGQIIVPQAGGAQRVTPILRGWIDQDAALSDGDLPPDVVFGLDGTAATLADRIGAFTTTAPIAFAPEAPGVEPLSAPPIRFGENVTFLGYERAWNAVQRPGDIVPVVTYWRVDGVVPSDLILFTHILGDPGAAPVAQSDAISVIPAALQPRDVFIQIGFIQLPFTLPAGTYLISIGGFHGDDQRRLDVFDPATSAPRGARLFIGDFRVE
ncbi:MAG: glycosyltransferase family 39 protein [Chloroflexota bacterium]|nr:glycosyltransferase family 39 protein [Chloroflexota bacterium]